ncbi:unnamed protein product [marine sediment metagenome]|uniref:Uncharacterized protein n=1 Tax=marine sediment metagenome TaxID=412755 RepID=X1VMT9_9ZZZZ
MNPAQVITAWRRDKPTYEKYFDDLKDLGWDDDRIEALKFFTEVYPTPRDYVGFLAHEVFEPDMIEKYGLLSEWGVIDKEPAKKIGLEEDILKLYWMDHWEHPEWGTIRELRHRDQITDQDVKVQGSPGSGGPARSARLPSPLDLTNRPGLCILFKYRLLLPPLA